MHDKEFARSLAQDIADFATAIRQTPDPFKTLSDLILKTHKSPKSVEAVTEGLLSLFESEDLVSEILNKRNAPRLQPFLTVYGGPAERTLGDELWGKGWGVTGRYEFRGCGHHKENRK